jgi:hypothetical protein
LELDIFDALEGLRAEEVLAAESVFAGAGGGFGAFPAAVGVVYGKKIGVT